MKKSLGILVSAAAVLALNGCGVSDYLDTETFYLQTYDEMTDTYVGVEDVYYECGPDIVGYTRRDGAFTFVEGDTCTFYDLDDTLSYEYDILYIGGNAAGTTGIADVRYDCDSGVSNWTDDLGAFDFDPTYMSQYSDGDVCALDFW